MSTFDDAFQKLLGNEGGYVCNPADPGGETRWGITARVAIANGYTGAMCDLPVEVAKSIAKSEYWDKYQCDQYDSRVAFQVFDAAYNGGAVVHWLQYASGTTQDGIIGAQTVAAVRATDPLKLIMRFDALRLEYLAQLWNWPSFGKGWCNRIAGNLMIAAE